MSAQEFSVIFHLVLTIFFHISFHFGLRWVYFGNKIVLWQQNFCQSSLIIFSIMCGAVTLKVCQTNCPARIWHKNRTRPNRSMVRCDILCHDMLFFRNVFALFVTTILKQECLPPRTSCFCCSGVYRLLFLVTQSISPLESVCHFRSLLLHVY